jgi:hypothetical protein
MLPRKTTNQFLLPCQDSLKVSPVLVARDVPFINARISPTIQYLAVHEEFRDSPVDPIEPSAILPPQASTS